MFTERYSEYLSDFKDSDLYMGKRSSITVAYETLTYDAIWALAIALNKTDMLVQQDGISLADFEYSRAPPDNDIDTMYDDGYDDTINNYITYNLSQFMNLTDFPGVSVSLLSLNSSFRLIFFISPG